MCESDFHVLLRYWFVKSLRPLLEHLLNGFLDHLLIFIAVFVEGVFSHPTPDQTFSLRVINTDDQCSLHTLLGGDAAHPAAHPAHAPSTKRGLLFSSATGDEDQVWILAFLR